LEYTVDPKDIQFELRIYQNDDIEIYEPTAEDIKPIINKIVHFNKLLEQHEGGLA
jgi:hypothetical protein